MKGPARLRDVNPIVSRLAAALDADAPSESARARTRAVAEKALSSVDGEARPSLRELRWTTPWLLGLIGLSVVACAIGVRWTVRIRQPDGAAAFSGGAGSAEPQKAAAPPPLPEASSGVATLRAEDLPGVPAPPEPQASPETRTHEARAREDARAAIVRMRGPAASSRPFAGDARTDASAVPAASSFHEELALLESARSSLARGDTGACLDSLNDYERRFRGGLFAQEVGAMRVEVLVARGDLEHARRLGDALLAKSPQSPYAGRIRSVLGSP